MGLALWLGTHGTAWPTALVVGQTVGLVTIALAERGLAFRPAWNRSHGDVGTDVAHAVVSGAIATQLGALVTRIAAVVAAGGLAAWVGTGIWPRAWPYLPQL